MATDTLEIFGTEYTGVTGIKATDDQSGTKVYIRPQGTKSISANGTGINVAEYASVNVSVPSGQPNLQSKNYTVNSAGTATVTADSGYDGLSSVAVSVPSAQLLVDSTGGFETVSGARKWFYEPNATAGIMGGYDAGWAEGAYSGRKVSFNAVPSGVTITPSTSPQTIGGNNYMMEGAVTVAAIPSGAFIVTLSWDSTEELWMPDKTITALQDAYDNDEEIIFVCDDGRPAGWFYDDDYVFVYSVFSYGDNELIQTYYIFTTQGVEQGTEDRTIVPVFESPSVTYTPTESQQTDTVTYNRTYNYNGMEEVFVTVNAIPSNYVGTGITRRSSTDLTASGATVTVPSGYYSSSASKAVASGTAGTPTATKGTVSNHSVSVTPSVTNSTGYITGSTKTGTAVTVSASELVSGSETKTSNGTYDVTNLAEIVVDVSGGGSSSVTVGTKTATLSSTASSISFTGLSGNPTSFVVTSSADIATNTNGVTGVVYDGTSLHGQTMTTQVTADTGFAKSYSGGTLTITATTASFQANEYKLVYTYNGSSSDIHTADVQVGSGATSITFSSLSGRPVYWSCIFKSDFSTSSGYQRVIEVVNDGTSIYGMAMDSEANAQTSWTATYSGGNLTISSSGTNNGGYFHQPGYYQLTYAVDDSAPQYQTKTVSPTTSQQTILPDSGYDALEEVIVNAMPTMTLPSSASSTSSGTSKATITPTSSAQYLNIPTGYNGTAQYYTIAASGGGGGANIATETMTNSSNQNTSISFTLPSGRTPKAFFARLTSQIARNSNSRYYYVFDMRWDGSSTGGVAGNTFYMSSGTLTNVTSGYSYSQSGTTFTLSSTGSRSASPGSFYNGTYELVYVY